MAYVCTPPKDLSRFVCSSLKFTFVRVLERTIWPWFPLTYWTVWRLSIKLEVRRTIFRRAHILGHFSWITFCVWLVHVYDTIPCILFLSPKPYAVPKSMWQRLMRNCTTNIVKASDSGVGRGHLFAEATEDGTANREKLLSCRFPSNRTDWKVHLYNWTVFRV